MNVSRGFTLIELLVVIALIGFLAIISLINLNTARENAREAHTHTEIQQVVSAINRLELDTDNWPNGCPPHRRSDPHVTVNDNQSGLAELPLANNNGDGCRWTSSEIAQWDGPYINPAAFQDGWGEYYIVDLDYRARRDCPTPNANPSPPILQVVVSPGPNRITDASGIPGSYYDCDDIYVELY